MTISKIIEKLTLYKLQTYLSVSPNYCRFESAYQTGSLTETALVKIADGFLGDIYKGSVIALVSLDISAAFDMVNHNLLMEKFDKEFRMKIGSDPTSVLENIRSCRSIIDEQLLNQC